MEDSPAPARHPLLRYLTSAENGASMAILAAMVLLPIVGASARWLTGKSLAGLTLYVQSLNLWIAMLGAALAARAHSHLSLSTGALLDLSPRARAWIGGLTGAVATAVTALLAYASVEFVRAMSGSAETLAGGIPVWTVQLALPVGFALMALRLAWGRPGTGWPARIGALVAVGLAFAAGAVPEGERAWLAWVGSGVLVGAVVLGAPIYTVIGGFAMLLFFTKPFPSPISAVPLETYDITREPMLVAIPLFTLAGYLLAEGGASGRLVRLFRAWVGWIPGGTAAAAVLVCAFFTTFTGASGVTILALGGLLLPILLKAGYPERFSIGVLAASGSIGLLFPPSLPVILYGATAHIPIDQLYLSGVVPGVLLVALLIAFGVFVGIRHGAPREPLEWPAALTALWQAKWEVALPVLVLIGIFGGLTTIFEAAAFTAAYAFVSEVAVHRDLSLRRDVPRVFVKCATLLGGVLIILGVAKGFTNYLIDAEAPMRAAEWVGDHVASKILFILLLNLFLLLVGCLMDIFSAIVVVVPLILPIGLAFGVDPFHLGILFLANLELGFLTPPVGMNLFLASYRFERPLTAIYRMALPFLGILVFGVLLIAYVPGMTTWPHGDQPTGPPVDELFDEPPPGLDLPSGIDLMNELDAEDDDTTPRKGLDLPDSADLMKELEGGDDDDATPRKALELPDPADLMKELEGDDDDSGGAQR